MDIKELLEQLSVAREAKRAADAACKQANESYDAVEKDLLGALNAAGLESVRGAGLQATRTTTTTSIIEDYDALIRYISRHKAWELLQRRLATRAVADRLEAGKRIPGIGQIAVCKLHVTGVR